MTTSMNRRDVLAAFGSVSLGALLAACGGERGSAPATTEVATTDGGTATVQPAAGGGSAAALLGDGSSCTLAAEQTEGPYFFDADAIRSDIREDREGTTLHLAVRVRDAATCEPLPNAVVDVWHCDAGGVYSGFEAGAGERFLRGTQVTNGDGIVEFTTVYPGWYRGRTVHVHAKVHVDGSTALTTQLYFDEELSDRVYAREPYAARGPQDMPNSADGIFDASLVLTLAEDGDEVLGAISLDVRT